MKKPMLFFLMMGLLLALAVCQTALPGREISEMENRMLAERPAFTASGFLSGSFSQQTERFAADQLPLRDGFVSLYSAMQGLLGRRSVGDTLVGDGMLFNRSDGFSERNVRMNAAALRALSEKTGKPVYLLAVPSAAAVYPEKMPAHAPAADEAALLAAAEEENALLPLLPSLLAGKERGEPLFYATDHHWTAFGARSAMNASAGPWGWMPGKCRRCKGIRAFTAASMPAIPCPGLGRMISPARCLRACASG